MPYTRCLAVYPNTSIFSVLIYIEHTEMDRCCHWCFMVQLFACRRVPVQNIAGILDGYEGIGVEFFTLCRNIYFKWHFLPLSPPGSRGIVVTVRAGDCQICGTHIAVTAWRIYSAPSSVELYRPVIVHCPGHLPICPIWACPWTKNLSNLAQIGSRLFGTQICETTG